MFRSDILEHPVWGMASATGFVPPRTQRLDSENGTDRLVFILIGSLYTNRTTYYVQELRI
jgi:hypothetical protein